MPLVVKCGKCGFVFLETDDLPTAEAWYAELYSEYEKRCPECGHQLPSPTEYPARMRCEVTANPAAKDKSPLVSAFKHDYHRRRSER